jgi:hypothetical protein
MRSKQNTKYYNDRILKLFALDSDYKKIAKRYDSLRLLLQEKYPFIKDQNVIELLKDTIYLDRLLRLYNEGNEKVLKKTLSDEFILQTLN